MKKIAFLCLLFLVSGCGYTAKSLLPPDVKTIYVKTLKNKIDLANEVTDKDPYKIYRPGTEQLITDEIINRFLYDGNLKIALEPKADLVFEGELIDYIKQALKYDDAEQVTEFRINVVIKFKVFDRKNNKELVSQDRLISDATYLTSGRFARSEEAALKEAAQDMARRVVEKVVESGW